MSRSFPWQLELMGLLLVGTVVLVANRVRAFDEKDATPAKPFAQATIDVGCFVSDPDASVAAIPKDIAEEVYLACVRDPDGNFIELLGPKK